MNQAFIAFYRNHVDTGEPLTDDMHCWTMPAERYKACLAELEAANNVTVVGHGLAIEK